MAEKKTAKQAVAKSVDCGVVMPISSLPGCSAEHWVEVKHILFETVLSIGGQGFTPQLVSAQGRKRYASSSTTPPRRSRWTNPDSW